MTKNVKRIVIAAGVAVVILLAFVMLKYVFPEPEPPASELEASPSPTIAPAYYVIQADGEEVTQFHSTYADGSTFTIDIKAREDGGYEYSATPDDTFFGYNTSKFRSMMYTMTSLTATAKVEEDPEDLSVYGLDQPNYQIRLTFRDGSEITLLVGNEAPVLGHYYAMTDRDNIVYTIGSYISNLIMRKPIEFRNVDIFPKYEDEEIYTSLNHFILTRRDGTEVEIWLDEDYSMEGNKSSSAYMMTLPVVTSCAEEKVENLLDNLATVSYNAVVGDITGDQLKEYGLDRPARLNLYDRAGSNLDIVVGTTMGTNAYAVIGRQYDAFMAGEIDYLTVHLYTMTDYEWTNLTYMDLAIRAIWIINIHDVESIVYDFNGEIYDMELYEYDDVTGSGVDVVRTCSYINGKDIHETNTKRIFSRTLNFREVDTIPEGMVYEEDYSYSITVNMRDGSTNKMTFHKVNERQFAVVVNGKAEYYVYKQNVDTLLLALERAMDDREVSLVYRN